MGNRSRRLLRRLRGFLYRRMPSPGFFPSSHRHRVVGFGRRWGCEERGWTQEGFSRLVWEKLFHGKMQGLLLECACGSGLVGSLGWWLEKNSGWSAECHEWRISAATKLGRNRPAARIHPSLNFLEKGGVQKSRGFDLITSRSVRTTAAICRMMRRGLVAATVIGVWNPTGRDLWARRLGKLGYRMVLCRERLELYQKR